MPDANSEGARKGRAQYEAESNERQRRMSEELKRTPASGKARVWAEVGDESRRIPKRKRGGFLRRLRGPGKGTGFGQ